tara:strand:- start:4885 stop:5838 length:954 start_codon:yes stop_codon:yes gene_type:complete
LPKVDDDRVVVGFEDADDAAVVRLDGDRLLVQTVDFFTPIVDDPYDFGQIAAANSLSDIYAMGGKPMFALNIAAFPINDLPKEVFAEILKGGGDKAKEAGISIVGGHSIDDKEPKYGLVVTGDVDENQLVKNSTANPSDSLVLTKPLGTGIIATAIKKGVAEKSLIEEATAVMIQLNELASSLMAKHGASAATDVTGYGLLGHLLEMCRASQVSAEISFSNLPFIDGVENLALDGIIPGGTKRNFNYVSPKVNFRYELKEHQKLMVADAQTSGGLLISLPQDNAQKFVAEFNDNSPNPAVIIGTVTKQDKYPITVVS